MDVDPLADTVPPRHAVESDEEEDEYNPLRPQSSTPAPVDVQLIGNVKNVPVSGLLVATGDVAKFWGRGANLGEQIAAVGVNKIQVGLLFRPKWTDAVVLVSEVTTRLPLGAMHPYARKVIDALQPKSIALLDTYGAPAYIAEERIAYPEAPLRPRPAQLFAPPNLVQSTSAAFVALCATVDTPATLLLLPAPHIAAAAPRTLEPANFAHLLEEEPVHWPVETVRTAQVLAFAALGEQGKDAWTAPKGEDKGAATQVRKKPVEFGMYIW
ncbi:hypothetical protein C8J57DRAFT_1352473 [Mycena rebaudengoi]|nr:hypothetical protein C8J57DRAFT_1352473 [Mycena rebaudengoi]